MQQQFMITISKYGHVVSMEDASESDAADMAGWLESV